MIKAILHEPGTDNQIRLFSMSQYITFAYFRQGKPVGKTRTSGLFVTDIINLLPLQEKRIKLVNMAEE